MQQIPHFCWKQYIRWRMQKSLTGLISYSHSRIAPDSRSKGSARTTFLHGPKDHTIRLSVYHKHRPTLFGSVVISHIYSAEISTKASAIKHLPPCDQASDKRARDQPTNLELVCLVKQRAHPLSTDGIETHTPLYGAAETADPRLRSTLP